MTRNHALALAFASLWSTLQSASVRAQVQDPKNFDGNRLRPGLGRESMWWTESGTVPAHLSFDVALWLNYANDAVVLNDGDRRAASLLSHRVDTHVVGSLALFDLLQIGIDLPVTVYQARDAGGRGRLGLGDIPAAGLGDLALTPKVALLTADKFHVDLAFLARVTIATAQPREGYFGERKSTVTPELALSVPLGDLTLGANMAALFREVLESGRVALDLEHELLLRLGARYDFQRILNAPLSITFAFEGFTQLKNPFSASNGGGAEWLLGPEYEVFDGLQLFAAAGSAMSQAYGIPDFRVLAGARYSVRDRDRDGDGIQDSHDQCPERAEDKDGFADADGCPDLDNDADDLPDTSDSAPNDPDRDADGHKDGHDQCPDEPEDRDDFQDDDGCPDTDNDGDGVPDATDGAPNEPEDVDGYQDLDGVPDPDNDRDGIDDAADQCPLEAEDRDTFEDEDGCPDIDNDGDEVLDVVDNCPLVKGTRANYGCVEKQLVTIKGCKIDLTQKVYFDTGRSSIRSVSHGLLDNIAALLKAQDQLKRISIEGHTDDRGSDELNKRLSQERADSVRTYLVKAGIASERLQAVGHGEEMPIASNTTSRGRETNRRVEFLILDCKEVTKEVIIQE